MKRNRINNEKSKTHTSKHSIYKQYYIYIEQQSKNNNVGVILLGTAIVAGAVAVEVAKDKVDQD